MNECYLLLTSVLHPGVSMSPLTTDWCKRADTR